MPVTTLGPTRAMAGPNPFHSAFTPSVAIVLRAQSMIPEYVPVGADCNLDFRTYEQMSTRILARELGGTDIGGNSN
jgi:hypothetical protein